jgi:hypothetical protein
MPAVAGGRSAVRFVARQLTGHLQSPAPETDRFEPEEETT